MKLRLDAGPTAVLTFDNFTVVVFSRSVSLFDRAMYSANGLDPRDFDLIVVKSPHTEHHMYDAWVEKNFNIDAPGATSANLPTLGHTICARPMFPLDEDVTFIPRPGAISRDLLDVHAGAVKRPSMELQVWTHIIRHDAGRIRGT